MTRADLCPLPKESKTRIDLIRARHEVKIRSLVLNWRTEKTSSRPLTLTSHQQSELQDLLVAMSVELGETEGRERLSAVPDPGQFVSEIEGLLLIVAREAANRWHSLTSDFRLQASTESEDDGSAGEVFHRVRELLTSTLDSLILQSWSAYEKRLQAETEYARKTHRIRTVYLDAWRDRIAQISPDGEVDVRKIYSVSDSKTFLECARAEPDSVGRVVASGSSKSQEPSGAVAASLRSAARRAVVMPILKSKRWTRGRWATEAGVSKNSVYEYLKGTRTLKDENRQAMAEALGLKKPTDLPD
jgi:hypothetical protein